MSHTLPQDLGAALHLGASQLGLQLTADAQQQLLAYLALLHKWNQVYNLTAVRDPQAMLTQHLLDSLAISSPSATAWPATTATLSSLPGTET